MHAVIVAGPTCSGKSTFIKKNFPDYTVIDLFDFQKELRFMNVESVMESYMKCRDALIEALKQHENVVLEHTLLKAQRRGMYIDAIRSVTDAPLDMYFLIPSDKKLLKQMKKRKFTQRMETVQSMKAVAELPTVSEGYTSVHIISDDPNLAHVEYAQ